ncbi:uncharacterized protein LOC132178307 isoform X2 [Corylus avellana]|uniref:uncharacterized protein LOC132178307 isoform X2 n=1 Tax=Corylus avellana TaxID=13451 RepID=UPI00286C3EBB|nr:uncharacterized protein LOC132178307 isoform X2 [Corylus avellana]
MSVVGILKFALKFLDVLAWPLFALGYPLCASIRAIETNSNWETQKLVTYWISFSLVSLFEHSFLNLLQWIQFWPHIKLMIICMLVIPYFDGSFYVYNHLVRPYLSINPQVIVDAFNKLMVLLHKRDHFLAEAEKYIKENGPEALEKLIANELKTRKPNVDVEEIKAIEATEKKEVERSHSKVPDTVQKDNEALIVIEKKEVPEAKGMVVAEPSLHQTHNKTSTTIEIKGPDVAVAAAIELPDIHMSKDVQKEWTCAICEFTTKSEITLNIHLETKKHKANFEALKAKNQPNIAPASTAKKTCQPIEKPQKIESTNGLKGSTITNHEEKEHGQPKSVSSSTARESDQPTKVVPHLVVAEPSLHQTDNKTSTTMEIKGPDVAVAAAVELPDIHMSKEVQKEWTCAICQLTTNSEKTLNIHLEGKKHKANFEALKAKSQPNIAPASTAKKTCLPTEKSQKIESTDGLKGSTITNHEGKEQGQPKSVSSSTARESDQPTKVVPHLVVAEPSLHQIDNKTPTTIEIKGPNVAVAAAIELPDIHMSKEVQKEWTCAICQFTTKSEKTLNIHLEGKKHKANFEALKAKNQPNIAPASTAKKNCQPTEKPQKIESTNGLKGSTITNHEGKKQGQPKSVSSSTAKESDLPAKVVPEKNAKNEAIDVKNSTFRCNICNISCTAEVNFASHLNGKKHLARVKVTNGCGDGRAA